MGFRGQTMMDEVGVRVRLKFQDAAILTTEQIEQGLAQSWYLIRLENLHTIADVSSDIRAAFKLEESCPDGLSLEMDGFVLPVSQPASLLKNSDLVRVRRNRGGQGLSRLQISDKAWNRHVSGAKDRMLDESWRRNGEAEEEMNSGLPSKRGMGALEEAGTVTLTGDLIKTGGKKRKQADAVVYAKDKLRHVGDTTLVLEPQEVELGGNCDSATAGNNKLESNENISKKKKRKNLDSASAPGLEMEAGKKKRRRSKETKQHTESVDEKYAPSHADVLDTSIHTERDGQPERKQKKRIPASPPDNANEVLEIEANITHEPTAGLKLCKKKAKTTKVLTGVTNGNEGRKLLSKVDPVADGLVSSKQKSAGTQEIHGISISKGDTVTKAKDASEDQSGDTVVEKERIPSRSARRKKNKRRWLREQAKMADLQISTPHPDSNALNIESGGMSSKIVLVAAEEAVEEMKPVVVRAGHIRFEPLDEEDADGVALQHLESMPVLHLGDKLMSKRQGQNWGQEKSGKYFSAKDSTLSDGTIEVPESCDEWRTNRNDFKLDPVAFEQLPHLGEPQVEDVLVYRIVELGTSWTPQISTFRIGAVVRWEKTTGTIRLDSVNPSLWRSDNLDDENTMEEENEFSLYGEDGALEIKLSDLIDPRLLRRDMSNDAKMVHGSSSKDAGKVLSPRGDRRTENLPRNPAVEIDVATPSVKDAGDQIETARSGPWQDVVEELEKKKTELLNNVVGRIDESENRTAISERDPGQFQNSPDPSGENTNGKPTSGGNTFKKDRRQHRRSAGVGSILAFLRQSEDNLVT